MASTSIVAEIGSPMTALIGFGLMDTHVLTAW